MQPSHQGVVALGAFLLFGLAAVAVPARAQATPTGWTTATRITTDSGNGHPPVVSGLRVMQAGTLSRTELFQGSDSGTPQSIVIVDTGAKTMIAITPSQQSAMLIAYPGDMLKAIRDGVPIKPVGTPDVHTEEVGDGPVILGHPTRHYRTTIRTVVHYAGPTVSCDRTTDTHAEIWATRDSIGPRQPGHGLLQMESTAPQLVPAAMQSQGGIEGEALRSERVTRVDRGDGAPTEERVTGERTQLTYGPIDPSAFIVPAGYRLVDQRAMMAMIDQKKMFEAVAPMLGAHFCGTPAATH